MRGKTVCALHLLTAPPAIMFDRFQYLLVLNQNALNVRDLLEIHGRTDDAEHETERNEEEQSVLREHDP